MLILNLLCRRSQFPQLQQRQLLLLSSRVRQTVSQGSCQQCFSQSQSVDCPRISFVTDTTTNLRTFPTSLEPPCQLIRNNTKTNTSSSSSSSTLAPLSLSLSSSSSSPSSSSSSSTLSVYYNSSRRERVPHKTNYFGPVVPLLTLSTHARSLHTGLPSSGLSLTTNYSAAYYFEMNSKHLSTGSTCPPLQDGKVRIYNMRFCPYAQRAVLVAIAKEIPHDVVNINLKEKPEWIFPLNPMGKVPTIVVNSKDVLYESLVVADYLDEAFPNRPLQSSDPFRKALDRILVENFGAIISSFYKMVLSKGDTEELKTHLQKVRESWIPFEKELEKRGTKFFGGSEKPGMVDYMIWPWVERLPCIKLFFPDLTDYEQDKKENPRLEEWRQAMKADPAVKEVYITPEQHQRFTISFMSGTPDYDLLAE